MREYELIYVIQPDATDERRQEIHDRIDSAINGGQGLFLLRDDWGKRKLAFEVQKFQKGHYFQLNFLGDGKFIGELERGLRLDAEVLRFLTVLANENVVDIDARVAEAKVQAAEQAERRAERERLEAEREAERQEAAASAAAEETAREAQSTETVDEAPPSDGANEVATADASANSAVEEE